MNINKITPIIRRTSWTYSLKSHRPPLSAPRRVLGGDVHADADEHHAPSDFRLAAEHVSRFAPDFHTHGADGEGHRRDNGAAQQIAKIPGQHPGVGHHRQGHPHRHGVDAGGHRHDQQVHPPAGIPPGCVVLPAAQHLPQHFAPDEDQKPERDPVIEGLDLPGEQPRDGVADEGHNPLKQAERPGDLERLPPPGLAQQDTAADGYGEGVHGQPHGHQQQGDDTQNAYLPEIRLSLLIILNLAENYVIITSRRSPKPCSARLWTPERTLFPQFGAGVPAAAPLLRSAQ